MLKKNMAGLHALSRSLCHREVCLVRYCSAQVVPWREENSIFFVVYVLSVSSTSFLIKISNILKIQKCYKNDTLNLKK